MNTARPRKDATLLVRLSSPDKRALEECAAALDLPVSALARNLIRQAIPQLRGRCGLEESDDAE